MSSLTPRKLRNSRDFHFQHPRSRSPHRGRRVLLRPRPRFPTSRGPTVRIKNLGLSMRSVTPAALTTGIRSDLPGQVTAQVIEMVYDSPTGQHLLIPQGSRLIGVYNS